jgi:hypothetical protein
MALPRQLGRGTMSVPSHAGDQAAEATWPRRDVDVKSCWHGAAEATWLWHDATVESC